VLVSEKDLRSTTSFDGGRTDGRRTDDQLSSQRSLALLNVGCNNQKRNVNGKASAVGSIGPLLSHPIVYCWGWSCRPWPKATRRRRGQGLRPPRALHPDLNKLAHNAARAGCRY
jgi:hypothetical protein